MDFAIMFYRKKSTWMSICLQFDELRTYYKIIFHCNISSCSSLTSVNLIFSENKIANHQLYFHIIFFLINLKLCN